MNLLGDFDIYKKSNSPVVRVSGVEYVVSYIRCDVPTYSRLGEDSYPSFTMSGIGDITIDDDGRCHIKEI